MVHYTSTVKLWSCALHRTAQYFVQRKTHVLRFLLFFRRLDVFLHLCSAMQLKLPKKWLILIGYVEPLSLKSRVVLKKEFVWWCYAFVSILAWSYLKSINPVDTPSSLSIRKELCVSNAKWIFGTNLARNLYCRKPVLSDSSTNWITRAAALAYWSGTCNSCFLSRCRRSLWSWSLMRVVCRGVWSHVFHRNLPVYISRWVAA